MPRCALRMNVMNKKDCTPSKSFSKIQPKLKMMKRFLKYEKVGLTLKFFFFSILHSMPDFAKIEAKDLQYGDGFFY